MCVFYWQKLLIYKVSSSRDFRFFFFSLIATRRSWWWWWRRVIVSHRKKDHLKFKSLSKAQEYVRRKSLLFQIKCVCDHGQNYLRTTCQLIHICSRAMRLRTTQEEKRNILLISGHSHLALYNERRATNFPAAFAAFYNFFCLLRPHLYGHRHFGPFHLNVQKCATTNTHIISEEWESREKEMMMVIILNAARNSRRHGMRNYFCRQDTSDFRRRYLVPVWPERHETSIFFVYF